MYIFGVVVDDDVCVGVIGEITVAVATKPPFQSKCY
jgi:hypothetical protein